MTIRHRNDFALAAAAALALTGTPYAAIANGTHPIEPSAPPPATESVQKPLIDDGWLRSPDYVPAQKRRGIVDYVATTRKPDLDRLYSMGLTSTAAESIADTRPKISDVASTKDGAPDWWSKHQTELQKGFETHDFFDGNPTDAKTIVTHTAAAAGLGLSVGAAAAWRRRRNEKKAARSRPAARM